MLRILLILFAIPLALLMSTNYQLAHGDDAGVSAPAPVVDSATGETGDVGSDISQVIASARSGNWKLLLGGLLSLLMTLAYKFKVRELAIFKGDRGGAILVMLLALMGAFASALSLNQPINLNLVVSAIGIAFTAVGGWAWFNKILKPKPTTPTT